MMAGSAWFKVTPVGLDITRKTKPPFEQWESEVVGSEQRRKSEPWWRGDLYLKGEEWYGENKATSVFDPLTMDVKTWQNNASVCGHIEISRRREELTYSHHAEVAYLEPTDQDKYLQLAIENLLSVRKLRDLIRSDDEEGDDVMFRTRALNERCETLRRKVDSLVDDVKKDLPMLGTDAAAHLINARDELVAAKETLDAVYRKQGKKAA